MKQCPRCAAEITSSMKKCDRCGLPLDSVDFSDEIENESKLTKAQKQERKRLKKLEIKNQKREKKERESVSNTDFSKYATNSTEQEVEVIGKPKKNKNLNPVFELDENGEFNIDTKDVELVGEETGKIIEEQYTKNYSVKKARGDYREPKIKWWEIYKLADRSFARRKIKKEVNKAAKFKPDFISKTKLLLLAIFFGWCGAQNFYAKNKKKGIFQLITLFLWVFVTTAGNHIYFFSKIQVSIGGFAGFLTMLIWISDIFNIVFNSFKYRIQKEKFIFSMNVQTRAKLGEKYIDLELYKKPWWFRFKVWCQKKKRGYEEWKHDRRQRLIEKEKAKIAKREEKDKIEAEIAHHEELEEAEIKKQKRKDNIENIIDKSALDEVKALDDGAKEETEAKQTKVSKPKTAKAKFSNKTSSKKNTKNTSNKNK